MRNELEETLSQRLVATLRMKTAGPLVVVETDDGKSKDIYMEIRAEKISREFIRTAKNTNILTALKETDFELPSGQITEIVGRSGSGKSTLLNMIAGLLLPTSGRIMYDETDLYALSDEERSGFRNRHIGVIPQVQTGLQSLTVLENILLPCQMYGDTGPYREYADELMERLEITSLRDAFPNELSGGELRRLSIARALLKKPEVLLADEPTGDLDDENTQIIFRLLKESARAGAAVLLVTHDREGDEYADRIFRMHEGILEPV